MQPSNAPDPETPPPARSEWRPGFSSILGVKESLIVDFSGANNRGALNHDFRLGKAA